MAEVVKIDDRTWRVEDTHVRFFLLTGEKQAVLIDSGMTCKNAKEIASDLTDLPIMLLNTHGDGDHISGTGAFSEIYMAKEDYYNKEMNRLFPHTALRELQDGDRIDLGGRTLEIIKIPGHTKGSLAILDVEQRVLYSGDSVQSGFIYMFGDHRNPAAFEEALQKLIRMKNRFDSIVPSHDSPSLEKDYIDKVLDGWKEVQKSETPYEVISLYGTEVRAYKTRYCGFYCDL